MKRSMPILAALLAGFVGGFLGARVESGREGASPKQLIRARSFELIDEMGKPLSFWGTDKAQNAVLAFGSGWPEDTAKGRNDPPADLTDPRNQRAAFGVLADSPFVDLRGTHGETRMRLNLSIYQKPLLWMGDETGKRLALGVEHSDTPGPQDDDWHLVFNPDRAWIGMFSQSEGGTRYVRGFLSISKDKVKYPYNQPDTKH